MKTTRVLFVLALALPFGATEAQQPAGGPPVEPITTALRNRTTAARRNIAQAFDSIPEAKFTYKPTPAQLTIGYIAQHVTADNLLFCNQFGDKKFTPDADASTPDSIKATWPKAKLVANLKASIAFCDDAFTQLTDAKLAEMITVQGPNNTTRQVPRINYVLGHALDLADHYSQLANYMRLNGMLPPTALPRPGRGGN